MCRPTSDLREHSKNKMSRPNNVSARGEQRPIKCAPAETIRPKRCKQSPPGASNSATLNYHGGTAKCSDIQRADTDSPKAADKTEEATLIECMVGAKPTLFSSCRRELRGKSCCEAVRKELEQLAGKHAHLSKVQIL